jgi:hypothetical protein
LLALPALAAGTALALRWRDPHLPGSWPPCPFRALTGLPCPGCGGLRALDDLGHGQLGAALGSNALAVLLVVALAVAWAVSAKGLLRERRTARAASPGPRPRVLVLSGTGRQAVVAIVVVFGLLRLLPGTGLLGP